MTIPNDPAFMMWVSPMVRDVGSLTEEGWLVLYARFLEVRPYLRWESRLKDVEQKLTDPIFTDVRIKALEDAVHALELRLAVGQTNFNDEETLDAALTEAEEEGPASGNDE